MKKYSVAVIGGDHRSIYAAGYLADAGVHISMYALEETEEGCCHCLDKTRCKAPYLLSEAVNGADAILFPIPFSRDGQRICAPYSKKSPDLPQILSVLKDLQKQQKTPEIFGGNLPQGLFDGFVCHDLLKDEEFTDANALATAENALALAILNYPGILTGGTGAILGYGRIARYLHKMLGGLNVSVTVYARSEEARKEAERRGAKARPFQCLEDEGGNYHTVFNTVPCPVVSSDAARTFPEDGLFIELASAPYGLSEQAKEALNARYLFAPGLPGRYSPAFAGKLIARYVMQKARIPLQDNREGSLKGSCDE